MADVQAYPATRAVSFRRLTDGVAGGLAGGVVFGMMMQTLDMIQMVAMLVDSTSTAVGWLVHLVIAAFIGSTFAVLLGARAARPVPAVLIGMGYGVVWWVVGALVLMPAQLGMDVFVFNTMAWQSLMGHLAFGLVLGLVFALLTRRGQGS